MSSFNQDMSSSIKLKRLKKELELFNESPPPLISCWTENDASNELGAIIIGSSDSPYEGGTFRLRIQLPDRYPFEPPNVTFTTKVYHPNIDTEGRICLDILKMPPKGSWKPAQNIRTVLASIQLLMNEPNPDDPLMADIAEEYRSHRVKYIETAKLWTERHAKGDDDATGVKEDGGATDVTEVKENINPKTTEGDAETTPADDAAEVKESSDAKRIRTG